MEKTIGMRALEGKKIAYEVLTYPDSMRDAEEIAGYLGLLPDSVFKTLVVMPPEKARKPMLVMLAANAQLDVKKLAAAMGAKKLKMATHREAEEITGLQVGGISPLALLNKGFQILIDESARDQMRICVSAGKRGMQIRLKTADLTKITNARYVQVAFSTDINIEDINIEDINIDC